ncbi:MAG: glycosyltransferase family 2 protein [bacterium]
MISRRKNSSPPEVSVVIPVYRNRETLSELHRRLKKTLGNRRHEMIFVDDHCPRGSLRLLRTLETKHPEVKVIPLKTNRGQHRAVLQGLSLARGKNVVILDADLQDPPEAIPQLLEKLREGFSAVFAGRRGRYESASRLFTSRLFKTLLHWITGIPRDAGMFVAMDRKMADRLLRFSASRPFLTAMMGLTGLPTVSLPVLRRKRPRGVSAYSDWKRLETGLFAVAWALRQKGLSLAFLQKIQKGAFS